MHHGKSCILPDPDIFAFDKLGKGERPVLNPEQTTAGPASYFPVASCAKTTSPLDGFTVRNLSPVTQFGKISSLKMKSMTSVAPSMNLSTAKMSGSGRM